MTTLMYLCTQLIDTDLAVNVSNLKIYKQAYKAQNNNARSVSIHVNLKP